MKGLISALLVVVVLGGILLWAKRPQPASESRLVESPMSTALPASQPAEPAPPVEADGNPESRGDAAPAAVPRPTPSRHPAPATPEVNGNLDVSQAVGTLVDPQMTHARQEALWKQLLLGGKLDEVIVILERRTAEDPTASVDLARLGHAYLLKAGTTKDFSQLASLGMKIDQTLERSLQLDTNSWEARFDKADSMPYWPAYLGKDNEVIEQFLALIRDQESQTPQPHFAQPYIRLGEQYQKLGYADYARETWQRGAAWVPQDQTLERLAARQSQ